jgi:hypothetical protein
MKYEKDVGLGFISDDTRKILWPNGFFKSPLVRVEKKIHNVYD